MSDLGVGSMVVGYGPTRWGQAEQEFTAFNWRPAYSSDQRTLKWIEIDFTLRFLVGQSNQDSGTTTELEMATLQDDLMKPGLELHVIRAGVGPVQSAPGGFTSFGLPTNSRDICWGPMPQSFTAKPFADQSAECTWRCLLRVPCCRDDALYEGGVVAWSWKVSWSIDRGGYTTRRTSGEVEVVRGRPEERSREMVDHADRLRERVIPEVPVGFRREAVSFDLSPDKAKATYDVIDAEVPPNAPPPGVVLVDSTHSVTTDKVATTIFRGHLSASYEVARDVSRRAAFNAFLALVDERVETGRGKQLRFGRARGPFPSVVMDAQGNVVPGGNRKIVRNAVMYLGFNAQEPEIYGRRCASFQIEYTFLTTLRQLVEMTNLWTPVGGAGGAADWERWAATMRPNAWDARGNARMKFDPASSPAIDICEDDGARPVGGEGRVLGGEKAGVGGKRAIEVLSDGAEIPDPEASWLYWQSSLRLEVWDESVVLQPLPASPPGGRTLSTPAGSSWARTSGPSVSPYLAGPASDAGRPPVVQVRAPSTVYVVLEGGAARAGYQITPPSLRSYGGVAAIPCNRGGGWTQKIAASAFGVDVWACRWKLRYVLAGVPAGTLPGAGVPIG